MKGVNKVDGDLDYTVKILVEKIVYVQEIVEIKNLGLVGVEEEINGKF